MEDLATHIDIHIFVPGHVLGVAKRGIRLRISLGIGAGVGGVVLLAELRRHGLQQRGREGEPVLGLVRFRGNLLEFSGRFFHTACPAVERGAEG